MRDALAAGVVAAGVSGLPSTAHALLTKRDMLEATVAAGSLLLPPEARRGALAAAAVPTHLGISLGWSVVLAVALPRHRAPLWGALAGGLIAALDLGVLGRRYPRIRALPLLPQVADHLAYGAAVGAVLARRESARRGAMPPGR